MESRQFQNSLQRFTYLELQDADAAVKQFFVCLDKLQNRYLATARLPQRLFADKTDFGVDVILCHRMIEAYRLEKQKNQNASKMACLIAALNKNDIKKLIEGEGEVIQMLGVLFSYFPENLTYDLESKIKINFDWIEKKLRDSLVKKSLDTLCVTDDYLEEKFYNPSEIPIIKNVKVTDHLFMELEEEADSDDPNNAVSRLKSVLAKGSAAEQQFIIDKLFSILALLLSRSSLLNSCDVLFAAIQYQLLSRELTKKMVSRWIDHLLEIIRSNEEKDLIVEYVTELLCHLAVYGDLSDKMNIAKTLAEESRWIKHFKFDQLAMIYLTLIDAVPPEFLDQMTNQLITISHVRHDTSQRQIVYAALAKLAVADTNVDGADLAQKNRERHKKILDYLLDELRGGGDDGVIAAIFNIVPVLNSYERVYLSRSLLALNLPNPVDTTAANILNRIHEFQEMEKIVNDETGLNKSLSEQIVRLAV